MRCEGSRPSAEYSHQTSAGRSENRVLQRPCEVNLAVKYEETQVQGRACKKERSQTIGRSICQQGGVEEVFYEDITRTDSQISNRQWEDDPVGGVMKLSLRWSGTQRIHCPRRRRKIWERQETRTTKGASSNSDNGDFLCFVVGTDGATYVVRSGTVISKYRCSSENRCMWISCDPPAIGRPTIQR